MKKKSKLIQKNNFWSVGEAPQSRTSPALALAHVRMDTFSRLDGGRDHNKMIKKFTRKTVNNTIF